MSAVMFKMLIIAIFKKILIIIKNENEKKVTSLR